MSTIRAILGGGAATALVAIVNGGVEGFVPTLQQAAIGVGAPTALSILAVAEIKGTDVAKFDPTDDLLVGVLGVGALMLMGGIPVEIDSGTVGLALMMSAGAYSADYLASLIGK